MNETRGLPKWWRADVLLTLGKISSVQGRLSAAEQYLNAALTESKQAFGEGSRLLPIYAALAKAYQREGMSTSSIVTFRDIFKRIRALPPAAENPLTKEDLIPFGLAVTAYAEKLTDDTQKQGQGQANLNASQKSNIPTARSDKSLKGPILMTKSAGGAGLSSAMSN
jgi:hypothetical protein